MNDMRILILPLVIIILVSLFSCNKGDSGANLVAEAGADTAVHIGDTVTLDAGASVGNDYNLIWSITSQPANDTVLYAGTDSAFFIPSKNGRYSLKLRISKGNEWDEDFKTVEVAGAIPLNGTISSDTVLVKVNTGDEADYIITSDLSIAATLDIILGVILEFSDGTGLIISETGQMTAENITFRAAANKWKGIHLKGPRTVMISCLIRDGGSGSFTAETTENANILLSGSAVASFSGNTFELSGGYGMVVKDNAVFKPDNVTATPALANNKFVANTCGPMLIPAATLSKLTSPDMSAETENTYVVIYESTYASGETTEAVISDFGLPYKLTGLVKFNKPLTILPGAEVYFTRTAGMIVTGNFNINGSVSNPVVMDGMTGTGGAWNGIYVRSGSTLITYASILNAGYRALEGLTDPAALTVEGTFTMQNSEVSGSSGIGIFLKSNAYIQYAENFSGNTLQNNMASAIRLGFDDVHKVLQNNTISAYSSSAPAIEVRNGKSDNLGTWTNLDAEIDYLIIEDVTLRATKSMTIESGSNLRFASGTIFNILGSLDASGVTFSGAEQTAGFWEGINISTDNQVTLNNCTIRNGGGGSGDMANLVIQPSAASVSITNSSIINSSGYGVLIKAGASGFGINDPGSNNVLEGALGGYFDEN
jgi:hypothetical protein